MKIDLLAVEFDQAIDILFDSFNLKVLSLMKHIFLL
jgi:hypothetical protein